MINSDAGIIGVLSSIERKSAEYVIVLAALCFLCLPLIYLNSQGVAYLGHDSWLHIQWGTVFSEQFWSGDLYPRWLADMDAGAGSPAMFYYPPLSYLITSPLSLAFPEREMFYWRMNISMMILIVTSFFTARLFLTSIVGGAKSLVPSLGALLYVSQPYFYIADIFVRGAFAEAWVFVWIPILFYGINNLRARKQLAVSCIVLGVFGVLTTHIVSAVFWLPISILYLLLRYRDKQSLLLAGVSMVLGFGLSSGYLFTALAYLDYASVSAMYGLEKIYLNFVLSTQTFEHLVSGTLKFEGMMLLFIAFSIAGIVFVTLLAGKLRSEQLFWLAISVVVLLAMMPISAVLWRILPVIHKIQFPWRMTAVLGLAMTVCYTLSLERMKPSGLKAMLVAIPLCLCIVLPLVIGLASAKQISDNKAIASYDGIAERSYKMYVEGKRPSFNAYEHELVPIALLEKYRYFDFVEIDDDSASYKIIENDPRSVNLAVRTSKPSLIRFKRQAYYGTQVFLNGELVDNDFDRKMIVLDLLQGDNTIHIVLNRMPIELAGYWATLISLIAFLLFLAAVKWEWFTYFSVRSSYQRGQLS